MSTQCNITVRKSLLVILTLIICISFLFVSCPLAPPEDPAKGLNPYLSPAAPIGLTATNGLDSSITIKWEESPNATSYEVWGIASSEFGTIDVPPFYKVDGDNTGYDPTIKGFQFFADVEGTSYTITNLPSNSAFVFCLRAIRDLGDQIPVASRLLYSAPSSYIEGSTKGDVALQVLATTKSVKLLWNVGNLFKALPDVSGAQEQLYTCSFDVLYRVHGTSQFGALPGATGLTSFSYNIPTSSTILDTRDTYDFQVRMTITTSTETNVYVTSNSVSAQPEENLVPEPVVNVAVSQGRYADGIQLSWEIPPVPVGFSPDSVFIVERQAENETEWETVLDQSSTQFSHHDNPLYDVPSESYIWKDTSAVDNTLYKYRVWNAYRFDQVIFLQDELDSSGASNVTESQHFGWKIWKIEGPITLSESDIVIDSGVEGSVISKKVTLSWQYGQKFDPSVTKWVLEERCWNQKDGKTTIIPDDITPSEINGSFTCLRDLELEPTDDPNYQKTYSYTLKIVLLSDGTVYQSIPADKETSLGKAQIAYFDSVTATKNLAKEVQLTWKLHKEKVLEGAISGDNDIWTDIIAQVPDAITYSILYSDANDTDIPVENSACQFTIDAQDSTTAIVSCSFTPDSDDDRSYRISAQLRGTGTTFNSSETVTGRPLSIPTGLTVAKGLSQESVAISWDVPTITDNIVYRLYRKPIGTGDDSWMEVTKIEDLSICEYQDTYQAGTNEAGAIYDYALDAYNMTQSTDGSTNTGKSIVAQGCLFGARLTNVQASDATDPGKIVITWNEVDGATKYKVMRRLKGSDDTFFSVTAQAATADNSTYTAEDTSIIKLGRSEQNPYPLSAQYDYVVQPIREVDGEATQTVDVQNCPVDSGFLFAPPENIRATVSQSVSSIDISWDAVKKLNTATGELEADPDVSYIVYYIETNGKTEDEINSAPWKVLKTVGKGVTSTTHSSLENAERHYNVVAEKTIAGNSPIHSEYQKFFPDGKSYCYGATLNAPSSLTVTRNKEKRITKVSWKAVPNVTTYVMYGLPGMEAGKELDVSSVTVPGTNNKLSEDTAGFIELDGEGAYTYCLAYMEYNSTYYPVSISSKNMGYESSQSTVKAYFDLEPIEILNIINTGVKEVLTYVDDKVNGDWWWGSDATYPYGGATVYIYGGGFSAPIDYLSMMKYQPTNIALEMTTTGDGVAIHPYNPGGIGETGYLGKDTMGTLGYNKIGTINVVGFKTANGADKIVTLQYDNIDSDEKTNSVEKFILHINGKQVTSSELSGTIVMPYKEK